MFDDILPDYDDIPFMLSNNFMYGHSCDIDRHGFCDENGHWSTWKKQTGKNKTSLAVISKPQISKIKFEEIEDEDIYFDVKTKPFKEVSFTPNIYNYVTQQETPIKPNAEKYFEFTLDECSLFSMISYGKLNDEESWEDGFWSVFNTNGIKIEYHNVENVLFKKDVYKGKYHKIKQEYKISVSNVDVPYIQMTCQRESVKYQDTRFTIGDTVTFFLKKKYKAFPPLLCVTPVVDTYVPMIVNQRIQVIIDYSLEYLSHSFLLKYSPITYIKETKPNDDKSSLRCHYFEYDKSAKCVTKKTECAYLTKATKIKNEKPKKICFCPLDDGNMIIDDPSKEIDIHAFNVLGVIFKTNYYLDIEIDNNCPAELKYTAENEFGYETMVLFCKESVYSLRKENKVWKLTV